MLGSRGGEGLGEGWPFLLLSSPLPKGISLLPSAVSVPATQDGRKPSDVDDTPGSQIQSIPGCLQFPEMLCWASWKLLNPLWTSCLRSLFGFYSPPSGFGGECSSKTLGEPGNGDFLFLLLCLRTCKSWESIRFSCTWKPCSCCRVPTTLFPHSQQFYWTPIPLENGIPSLSCNRFLRNQVWKSWSQNPSVDRESYKQGRESLKEVGNYGWKRPLRTSDPTRHHRHIHH